MLENDRYFQIQKALDGAQRINEAERRAGVQTPKTNKKGAEEFVPELLVDWWQPPSWSKPSQPTEKDEEVKHKRDEQEKDEEVKHKRDEEVYEEIQTIDGHKKDEEVKHKKDKKEKKVHKKDEKVKHKKDKKEKKHKKANKEKKQHKMDQQDGKHKKDKKVKGRQRRTSRKSRRGVAIAWEILLPLRALQLTALLSLLQPSSLRSATASASIDSIWGQYDWMWGQ